MIMFFLSFVLSIYLDWCVLLRRVSDDGYVSDFFIFQT